MAGIDRKYLNALIRDMHRGSSDAYAAVFLSCIDPLYAEAALRTKDAYALQDYVKDIFIPLFAAVPSLKDGREFRRAFREMQRNAQHTWFAEKKRKPVSVLTPLIRDQLLFDILTFLELGANTVPLDDIRSYNAYRHTRHLLISALAGLGIFTLASLPFLLELPSYQTDVEKNPENGMPVCTLSVNTHLVPISSVAADIEDVSMPVYKDNQETYRIRPTRNGDMTIRIAMANGRSETAVIPVSGVDETPPEIGDVDYVHGTLSITLTDDESGMDAISVYLLDPEENSILPSAINGSIYSFAADPDTAYTLYASDQAGNTYTVKLHVEGSA